MCRNWTHTGEQGRKEILLNIAQKLWFVLMCIPLESWPYFAEACLYPGLLRWAVVPEPTYLHVTSYPYAENVQHTCWYFKLVCLLRLHLSCSWTSYSKPKSRKQHSGWNGIKINPSSVWFPSGQHLSHTPLGGSCHDRRTVCKEEGWNVHSALQDLALQLGRKACLQTAAQQGMMEWKLIRVRTRS